MKTTKRLKATQRDAFRALAHIAAPAARLVSPDEKRRVARDAHADASDPSASRAITMNAEPRAPYTAHRPNTPSAGTSSNDIAQDTPRAERVHTRPASPHYPAEPPPWTGLQRSPLARAHTIMLVSLLSVGAVALGVAGHSLYDEYVADNDRSSYVAALARSRAAQSDTGTTVTPSAPSAPVGTTASPTSSLFGPDFIKGPAAALTAARHPPTVANASTGTRVPLSGAIDTRTPSAPLDPMIAAQLTSTAPQSSPAIAADRADQAAPDTRGTARGTTGRASARPASGDARATESRAARRAAGHERRALAMREARATREPRGPQAAPDPLASFRRLLHAAWWRTPPKRNRLDSGPQYKGQ
jgi:hypothetical protein